MSRLSILDPELIEVSGSSQLIKTEKKNISVLIRCSDTDAVLG